jgi:hypothetical protein
MTAPIPTPIYRFVHVDNLRVCLTRGGLFAPAQTPSDGLTYRTIHNVDIQTQRRERRIPRGPGGCIHDYVPFYFGYLSPMMLQLKTGWVAGYREGQEPLIYIVTTAQAVAEQGVDFVFSDGHGIANFTKWFDDLGCLDQVDWQMVYQRYWKDGVEDMDRQRRKQAEFLIYRFCPWELIQEVGVIDGERRRQVELILADFPDKMGKPVRIRREWYY